MKKYKYIYIFVLRARYARPPLWSFYEYFKTISIEEKQKKKNNFVAQSILDQSGQLGRWLNVETVAEKKKKAIVSVLPISWIEMKYDRGDRWLSV